MASEVSVYALNIYALINSKSTQPISINFFLKETRIFSLQNYEEFLSKFHLGDFFTAIRNLGQKFTMLRKFFPSRWNFAKNSSYFCREKILVSLKKNFIEIGSLLFELIHF